MTGFLCSLGGVCLTSLQTIRYCYSHSYMYVAFEIMFKVPYKKDAMLLCLQCEHPDIIT